MKYLFALLAIIDWSAAYAQNKSLKKGSGPIFIGFNFSTDYNYRALKNNGGDSYTDVVIDSRNKHEVGKIGFTSGLNFCIGITKLLAFETGIQYSNKGYQTEKYDLIYQQPDPREPVRAKFIYNYHYIDIPLKINLTAGKDKIHFISSAGFATNFLINTKAKSILEYSDGRTVKRSETGTDDFKKVNISPLISLGAEWKIKNKMYLRTEPTFRYQLLKNIDQRITAHLWNAGLDIGFYYRL